MTDEPTPSIQPTKGDMQLFTTALRQRWPMPDRIRALGVHVATSILADKLSTKREKLGAFRALLMADKINAEDERDRDRERAA